MTENEIKVLDYIRACITRGGFSPTLKEIGARVGVSKPGAFRIINTLEAAGRVRRARHKTRGIELADAPDLRGIDSAALRDELARRGEEPGAFTRPTRGTFERRGISCAVDGCQVETELGYPFCRPHWYAVDDQTQRELFAAHRAALSVRSDRTARRYQDVFGRAKDMAAFVRSDRKFG